MKWFQIDINVFEWMYVKLGMGATQKSIQTLGEAHDIMVFDFD